MGIDRCCWSIAPVCYSWRRYWKGCERWKAIKSPWVPRPSGSADFRPGVDSDRAGWFGLDHRTARTADHSTSNQTRSLSARMNLCDQLWRRRRKGGGGMGRVRGWKDRDEWPLTSSSPLRQTTVAVSSIKTSLLFFSSFTLFIYIYIYIYIFLCFWVVLCVPRLLYPILHPLPHLLLLLQQTRLDFFDI